MTPTQREAWLQERRTGVGSSDAPCLVGLGYKSPADIYRLKVGEDEYDPPRGRLLRGLALEGAVAAMYAEAMQCDVCAGPFTRAEGREWQVASIDRIVPDPEATAPARVVEMKTTDYFGDDWGRPMSDEIPRAHWVQVQHQLGVWEGGEFADVAALAVADWEFRVYRVRFDPDFFAWLTEVERRFWFDHVQKRVPPPADFAAALMPASPASLVAAGGAVVLPSEAEADATRLLAYKRVEKEAKRLADLAKERLLKHMGGAATATVGNYKMRLVEVAGGRVEAFDREPYSWLKVWPVKSPRTTDGELAPGVEGVAAISGGLE